MRFISINRWSDAILNLLKNVLLKLLALVYFTMFIISGLGYLGIGEFSTNIFNMFSSILGEYVLAIPIICLIFTGVCWYISQSYAKKKEDVIPIEREYGDNISNLRAFKKSSYGLHPSNGFDSYFVDELPIRETYRVNEEKYNHLGTNFSTYFGQGKRNMYMPSRVTKLQGFQDFFRNTLCEYDKVANDMTIGTSCKVEVDNQLNPRRQLYNPGRQAEEPRRERKAEEVHNINKNINISNSNNNSKTKWKLPGLELLNTSLQRDDGPKQYNPKVIEDVLSNFGVVAKVVNISIGPVITRYELSPNPGTKISKITNLADDIALALACKEIRIEAPIPGKAAIGIEIPRDNPVTVSFRDVIDSREFTTATSKLKVALGKTITDIPAIGELNKMPHLLVAGATGSGKSIFINCLVTSLLFNTTPDETKLLLIDPKMVELSLYNGIPHLLTPVVTDPKKASKYLKQIVNEMENRYQLFASQGIRDIDHYNNVSTNKSLSYIVVIIDELADLMMVSAHDMEELICRLAQKARAAGIHLVIATQRPSVNVITGLIKANIPSRISFAVSSQIDSRTILDAGGAERLLGKGDMLYSPAGLSKPQRIHGCFIDENEVKNVVQHWKNQGTDYVFTEEHIEESIDEEKMSDERFLEACKLVITSGVASVSFLQRRMRVGYSRAARLMDMLEDAGIVAISEGNKPRDILITLDDFHSNFG